MGTTSYSSTSRSVRAVSKGYTDPKKGIEEIFKQQKARCIHASMDPKGVMLRESRDSETHPVTTPIVLGLDMTASMGHIPRSLIAHGLPTLVTQLLDAKIPGPAICFTGVGDHKCDSYPFQLGQFESGDEELDMWLERTYIEGGGGGNGGESYMLSALFAAGVCQTDSWDKRKTKGFVFTIGDEPCHGSVPMQDIINMYGAEAAANLVKNAGISPESQNITTQEILDAVSKRWHWYHINCRHGHYGTQPETSLKSLLGENVLHISGNDELPGLISGKVCEIQGCDVKTVQETVSEADEEPKSDSTEEKEEKEKVRPGLL